MRLPMLFLVGLPIVEIALLIQLGGAIGGANTLLLVMLTGALGLFVAKREGLKALRSCQDALQQGQLPTEAMLEAEIILFSGLFLLLPGILTDVLGLLGLIAPIRRAFIRSYFTGSGPKSLFGRFVSFGADPSARPPTEGQPYRGRGYDGLTLDVSSRRLDD